MKGSYYPWTIPPYGMTGDSGPTTKEELQVALHRVILKAYQNGVQIDDGGYALNHDETDIPDWDIHITRVEYAGDVSE